MHKITIANGVINLSKGEIGFKDVLDDFINATHVNIVTYNISKNESELIEKLEELGENVVVNIVTNIPGRFESYIVPKGKVYKTPAQRGLESIEYYCSVLDPVNFTSDVSLYFNFNNHAKIISTNNVAYIGSANYSDESSNNYEAGIIIRDQVEIDKINKIFIPEIINGSIRYSTSYYNVVNEIMKEELNESKKLVEIFDEGLFTWAEIGYLNEVKILDTYQGSISKEKWEDFQNVWYSVEDIITEVISEFEDEVDLNSIIQILTLLNDKVDFLNKNLSEVASFNLDVFDIAQELDFYHTGDPDDLEKAFEIANEKILDERESLFEEITDKVNDIDRTLEEIPILIDDLITELNLLEDTLSNVICYENGNRINNTGEKSKII
jgi:hypothetical protein